MRTLLLLLACAPSAPVCQVGAALTAAPLNRVQPIGVTASASYPGAPPSYAIDGNSLTAWSAGAGAPQWIQLDLGRTVAVRKIRMQLNQNPAGDIGVSITAGQSPSSLHNVAAIGQYGSDNAWVTYDTGGQSLGSVRYIRITTTSSPSWIGWREIEVWSGVEFVGWFQNVYGNNGASIAETVGNGGNLVFVESPDPANLAAMTTALTDIANRGASAMVNTWAVFHCVPNNHDTYDCDLPLYWEQTWGNIRNAILAAPAGTVAAFYEADEPYHNPITRAELQILADRIRQDFPGIPIATVLAADFPSLTSAADLAMFDWVGYDCYGDWLQCQNDTLIQLLRARLNINQRMIAVPWAFTYEQLPVSPATEGLLVGDHSSWHWQVLADPKYVAILPYRWDSVPDSNGIEYGAREMPWVKTRGRQLQRSLLPTTTQILPVSLYASYSYDYASRAFGANDGNSNTIWSSGRYPSGTTVYWEADFGGSTRVTQMQLSVAQSPAGNTAHYISGLVGTTWIPLTSVIGYSYDGQLFTLPINADVSKIRVTTTQSPSWVAWKEVRFFK